MTKISMEEKRDIYHVALLIEESTIYKSRSMESIDSSSGGKESKCWDEWKMDFFGCCDEGWRKVLDNVYRSKVSETRRARTPEERSIIWKFWYRVGRAKLIGDGLHIAKVVNS